MKVEYNRRNCGEQYDPRVAGALKLLRLIYWIEFQVRQFQLKRAGNSMVQQHRCGACIYRPDIMLWYRAGQLGSGNGMIDLPEVLSLMNR